MNLKNLKNHDMKQLSIKISKEEHERFLKAYGHFVKIGPLVRDLIKKHLDKAEKQQERAA